MGFRAFVGQGFMEARAEREKRELEARRVGALESRLDLDREKLSFEKQTVRAQAESASTEALKKALKANTDNFIELLKTTSESVGPVGVQKLLDNDEFRKRLVKLSNTSKELGTGDASRLATSIAAIMESSDPARRGARAGAEKSAEIEAVTPAEAAQAGAVAGAEAEAKQPFEMPAAASLGLFLMPGQKDPVTVDLRDKDAVDAAIAAGGIFHRAQVQASSAGDLRSQLETRQDVKESAESQQRIDQAAVMLSRGTRLMRKITETPGLVGWRAKGAEEMGAFMGNLVGLVNQTAGETTEETITGLFSQASPEELGEFRSSAREFLSRLLPAMTGENSGRYTDTERAIVENAQKILKTNATGAQVFGALKAAVRIEQSARIREDFKRGRSAKGANRYDIMDPGERGKRDRLAIARQMIGWGFTFTEVSEFLKEMQETLSLM